MDGQGRKACGGGRGGGGPDTKGSVCKVRPCTCPAPPSPVPGGEAQASEQGVHSSRGLVLQAAMEPAQKAFAACGGTGPGTHLPRCSECRAPNRGHPAKGPWEAVE